MMTPEETGYGCTTDVDRDYWPTPNWLELVGCVGVIVCAVIVFVRWLL